MYILWRCFILNINDINNEIYGIKNFDEGVYANYMLENINKKILNTDANFKFGETNDEIKF